jgi:hypothetical protein
MVMVMVMVLHNQFRLVAVRGSTVRREGTRRRHTFRLHGHFSARSETAWSGGWKHLEHRATDSALAVITPHSFGRSPVKSRFNLLLIDFH